MGATYELGVELCKAWLACVIENQDCVYHFVLCDAPRE